MNKSEVYSWRLSPDLKEALEEAARERGASLSALLEEVVRGWLESDPGVEEEGKQTRLHQVAARHLGVLAGRDPGRSQRVGEVLRERLGRRRART